jgi:predicted nucleic acid-binding protein
MNAEVFVDTNILLYTIDDGQNYDGVTVVNPFTGVTP